MSANINAAVPEEVEEGMRIPVVITADRTRYQSVRMSAYGLEEMEEGTSIPVVTTTNRTRRRSVLGNFGGPREVERDIRDPVVTMMDLPEQESYNDGLKNVMLEYNNYKNSHPKMHTGSIEVKKVDDDQYYSKENILWREKCELTSHMNRMKAGHDEFVTNLILEHQKSLGTMKQEFEKAFQMVKNEYNEGIETLKHDMEEAKKKEIQKIEKSTDGRAENLAKYYHESFIGLKNRYDVINENSLSIIATLKDENMGLRRHESFLQMKCDTLSREHEFLRATNQKDADEINYSVQNKMKELSEKVKHLHQENDLLAERLKIIESERDALRSSFESVIQYVEDRIKTKATHAEQKVQTIQENLGKEPALWDPSLMCLPASRRRHELKEELARILDYIGHLGITARQSGPHAGMSQGTFGTAPTYQ